MKQWKIKNGEVMLDTFNKKRNIPPNRHRIPAVSVPQMEVQKKKPAESGRYDWDLDGRMHKKSAIKKDPQFISSKQALSKVDLPNIGKSKLSPRTQFHKSMPPGKMPNSKFIEPTAPKAKKLKPVRPPPTKLNN